MQRKQEKEIPNRITERKKNERMRMKENRSNAREKKRRQQNK